MVVKQGERSVRAEYCLSDPDPDWVGGIASLFCATK